MRSRIVVLGPDTDVGLVLHELAHLWHSRFQRHSDAKSLPPMAVTTLGEVGVRAIPGWADAMDAHIGRSERLADGLAVCWLQNTARPLSVS